ncbi:hypothetical protein C7M84_024622, partial [Penaeus vannamei]
IRCPAVHDGLACWPTTAGGMYALVPCPPSFTLHPNTTKRASRYCGQDGEWEPDAADYLACATDDIFAKLVFPLFIVTITSPSLHPQHHNITILSLFPPTYPTNKTSPSVNLSIPNTTSPSTHHPNTTSPSTHHPNTASQLTIPNTTSPSTIHHHSPSPHHITIKSTSPTPHHHQLTIPNTTSPSTSPSPTTTSSINSPSQHTSSSTHPTPHPINSPSPITIPPTLPSQIHLLTIAITLSSPSLSTPPPLHDNNPPTPSNHRFPQSSPSLAQSPSIPHPLHHLSKIPNTINSLSLQPLFVSLTINLTHPSLHLSPPSLTITITKPSPFAPSPLIPILHRFIPPHSLPSSPLPTSSPIPSSPFSHPPLPHPHPHSLFLTLTLPHTPHSLSLTPPPPPPLSPPTPFLTPHTLSLTPSITTPSSSSSATMNIHYNKY